MSTVPNKRFLDGMHGNQGDILGRFDRQEYRFYMLNWHRRARKSTLGINLLVRECLKNPKTVYTYVAPTYKQAKNIIWQDPDMLFSYLPKDEVEKTSQQDLIVYFKNGSLLRIMGGDDPDKLRGINTKGVLFDEWAVFSYAQTIWEEIFLPILRVDSDRWAMFIFTPKGQNYAFEMWNKAQTNSEWYTSLLRASESGIIPSQELVKAKEESSAIVYNQEYECAFVADEDMTFITSRMLDDIRVCEPVSSGVKKLIAVDPATGGDECVAYYFENTKIVDKKYMFYRDPKKILSELLILSAKYKCDNFIVDGVGLGDGVVADLRHANKKCYNFKAGESAGNKDLFADKKTESWWYVGEQIGKHNVYFPHDDAELVRQLSSVRYKMTSGEAKIRCVEKALTKKILGRSPDRADAYIMGIVGLQYIKAEEEQTKDVFLRGMNVQKKSQYAYNW